MRQYTRVNRIKDLLKTWGEDGDSILTNKSNLM
jgi:hypothetical protein